MDRFFLPSDVAIVSKGNHSATKGRHASDDVGIVQTFFVLQKESRHRGNRSRLKSPRLDRLKLKPLWLDGLHECCSKIKIGSQAPRNVIRLCHPFNLIPSFSPTASLKASDSTSFNSSAYVPFTCPVFKTSLFSTFLIRQRLRVERGREVIQNLSQLLPFD